MIAFTLDMCHVTLGNAPLEQEMLKLTVLFVGESGCSAVVRNVVLLPTYLMFGDVL